MDNTFFDTTYKNWSEQVPQIIDNIINNDPSSHSFIDENTIPYFTNLLLDESTKYDILA